MASLMTSPKINRDLIVQFDAFLENEVYKQLSEECHLLGFHHRFNHALTNIKFVLRRLVKQPLFKPIFNIGSKLISLNTQIPSIDSTDLASMVSDGYLPPIISLEPYYKKAKSNWRQVSCMKTPPEGVGVPLLEEGWVEIKADVVFFNDGSIAFEIE
jgi:hypothetical protein